MSHLNFCHHDILHVSGGGNRKLFRSRLSLSSCGTGGWSWYRTLTMSVLLLLKTLNSEILCLFCFKFIFLEWCGTGLLVIFVKGCNGRSGDGARFRVSEPLITEVLDRRQPVRLLVIADLITYPIIPFQDPYKVLARQVMCSRVPAVRPRRGGCICRRRGRGGIFTR